MDDCLFCRIASGEIPTAKIYEDEHVVAFNDINPTAPVHFLVIPREHIVSCADITKDNSEAVSRCFEIIAKLAVELRLSNGFRVVSNAGEQAGQSVPHLHFHVLANRDFAWPAG
ncbi:MAG: histidine triad nucleotide-binding protein [Oscillospiraceae bacterium]